MDQGATGQFPVTKLLDISVLLALAWPNHIFHTPAIGWIETEKAGGTIRIATSPITQLGFVRVSMNAKGFAQDFENAFDLFNVLISRPEFEHEFWPDDISLLSIGQSARSNLGSAQLTDFYLLNLAKARGGKLVTLDKGIKDPTAELIAT
jgi:predicted nucleic acid-binding protein